MKKKFSKTITLLMLSTIFGSFLVANTALANDADARYRDGSMVNYYEHAGVRKAGVGIYEIKGPFKHVDLSTWESFIGTYAYVGSFSNPTMTSVDKMNVLSTLSAMDADPDITYTAMDMIDWTSSPGSYINVSEITDLRCDGVVEYSYEWNNIWVWGRSSTGTSLGTPTDFDISVPSYASEHQNLGSDEPWIEISPIVQHGGSGSQWTKLTQNWTD